MMHFCQILSVSYREACVSKFQTLLQYVWYVIFVFIFYSLILTFLQTGCYVLTVMLLVDDCLWPGLPHECLVVHYSSLEALQQH